MLVAVALLLIIANRGVRKPVPCSDLKPQENINPYCFKAKKKQYFQGICWRLFLCVLKYVETAYILLFQRPLAGNYFFSRFLFYLSHIVSSYGL